jgi:general secretion pathway protein K
MRPARPVRGSVLIIVLVTLLFTGYALVAFSEKAGIDLLVEARAATAHRLRAKAYSTLEVVLAVLSEFRQADGSLRSPAEGWGDPLAFANWEPGDDCTAEVAFADESGKLSLAHVDYATLVQLFVSWGVHQADAEAMADSLMVWMRRDYVSTTAVGTDYDRGEMPYGPPQRSLRSYSELAAIDHVRDLLYDEDGRPNELWHRFAAALSLFDFSQTNINAANGDVLTALGSYDASQQQQLGDYLGGRGNYARQGPAYGRSTGEAAALLGGSALPPGFGTEIRALRIDITLHQGRSIFRLSAVVAPPGGAKTVQTTATVANATADDDDQAASPPPAPQNSATGAANAKGAEDAAKKLNYPFTLLEIKENDEIPPALPPQTQA